MEPAARDGVAVHDPGREERRGAHEQQPGRQDHRPVGEAALHDGAGKAGPDGHVRYVLPLASDVDTTHTPPRAVRVHPHRPTAVRVRRPGGGGVAAARTRSTAGRRPAVDGCGDG